MTRPFFCISARPVANLRQQKEPGQRFHEWAETRGIQYPKLRVSTFDGDLRGMRATKSLKQGEVVVRLPRSAALLIEPNTKSPPNVPSDLWRSRPWFVKLALRLVHESKQGDASEFVGYISCLPQTIDIPCFWPEADINQLYHPYLIKAVMEQKRQWNAIADEIVDTVPEFKSDRELFLRCLAFVRSRSFSGPYIGSKLSERLALTWVVVILAGLNIAINGIGSIEQTLNGVIAVSAFNVLYDFFLSRSLKVYLMAPGVDFMNHSSQVSCDLSYDYFSDGYSVRLDRDYDEDTQVFISYGQKSNDDLLQYFGFVERDSPNDSVRIEQGMEKLQQIFEDRTGCSLDNADPGSGKEDVEIFRQGCPPRVLSALEAWVREAGASEDMANSVLLEFCKQELAKLKKIEVSEANSGSRVQLLLDFRKEKMSVLHSCINELGHHSNAQLIA